MPGIRDYPQAFGLNPTDALILDRVGVGTMYILGSNLSSGATVYIAMNYSSVPPANSNVLSFIAPFNINLSTNMIGSVGEFIGGPSSTVIISVLKNGVSFGTITFPNGNSSVGVFAGTATSFLTGDLLEIQTPANLFGASNLTLTFAGAKAS